MDFGARLREARERRGITLREIATTTKISTRALEALERNQVSRLPGGIFTRAFVRSYASEVGLDPEETLREFLEVFPFEGVADGSPYARDAPELDGLASRREMTATVLRLVGLSLPVAGLIIYFGMSGRAPAGGEAGPAVPVESAEAVAIGEPTSGPLHIGIHPDAPCWVALTVDGELIFSRWMQPGEREVRAAREEIVLNTNDAGALAFTLNNRRGRRLGAVGESVTVRINQTNYQDYVVR